MIHLAELPYGFHSLEPHLTAATLQVHHEKHHAGYVKKVNELILGTPFERASLDEIVALSGGPLYNAAAQVMNHELYFRSMSPEGGGKPRTAAAKAIEGSFESFDALKQSFTKAATEHFGAGWCWLVQEESGDLRVVTTHDAVNPVRDHLHPVLACDLWEHAYYLDYQSDRGWYVDAWWKVVNWSFADERLK
jgi:Fe-Mn family superoxide dismutase